MQRIRQLLAVIGGGVLAVGLLTGVAHALASPVIQGTTDHTVFAAGSDVTISGTVNGDVFCAGQTVAINATINGDVLCAAQTLTLAGTVNGSVRLAGQTITVSAQVARSASLAGQSATLEDGAHIDSDASVAAQTATLYGSVARDLYIAGGTVMLHNTVGRDATVHADDLTLGSGAQIAGNMSYTSAHRLSQTDGAAVAGVLSYHQQTPHQEPTWRVAGGLILAKLYWLIAMALLGVVLVTLLPGIFRRWNPAWGAGFWLALATGFIAMVVIPVLVVILCMTLIGVPLALLVLLLWLGASLVSMPFAAYWLGKLATPQLHPIFAVILGSAVIGLVELVPVFGWIVGLLAYWLGLGIILRGLSAQYITSHLAEEKEAHHE